MDIREICAILPHRPPFLLVDRVVEHTEELIVGEKCVSMSEPAFAGHFPGHPVFPGVLILEALAQTGALFACKAVGFDPARQVIYFMGIDAAKFRKPVVPGDVLRLEVTPLRRGGAVWKMKGEAKVDGAVVASCEFLATLAARPGA